MEDYQGSEEAEVHYEKKKKNHLPLLVGSMCVCAFCVLLRNMPAISSSMVFDVDVDCWPHSLPLTLTALWSMLYNQHMIEHNKSWLNICPGTLQLEQKTTGTPSRTETSQNTEKLLKIGLHIWICIKEFYLIRGNGNVNIIILASLF